MLYLGVAGWLTWIVFREPILPPRQKAVFLLVAAAALVVLVSRFVEPSVAGGTP